MRKKEVAATKKKVKQQKTKRHEQNVFVLKELKRNCVFLNCLSWRYEQNKKRCSRKNRRLSNSR